MNKLTIVGIGPGDKRFLTLEAIDALKASKHVYFRTFKHPVIEYLNTLGINASSFDDLYDQADGFDDVYETIAKETLLEKPKKIPYQHSKIKYLHYGRLIEKLIHKAAELEEGEEKNMLIMLILNHMKKSYLNWNRNQVTDDLIFDNMKELSVGNLEIPDDMKLTETREILARARKKRMARKSK